jgi:Kinesin motor domain
MERGALIRATGATRMNEMSSRSHAVFMIVVEHASTHSSSWQQQQQDEQQLKYDDHMTEQLQSVALGGAAANARSTLRYDRTVDASVRARRAGAARSAEQAVPDIIKVCLCLHSCRLLALPQYWHAYCTYVYVPIVKCS